MAEVGSRDRLVMAGLVVLGLLTVVAGVLSGHSTIDYVLGRDANEAALSWARQIDTALGGTAENSSAASSTRTFRSLTRPHSRRISRAWRASPRAFPPIRASLSVAGLIEAIDRLTGGWALGRSNQLKDDFVSKLDGFAVLNADEKPIATAGNLTSGKLASLFALGNVRDTLAESTQDDAVKVTSTDEAATPALPSCRWCKTASYLASTRSPSTSRRPPLSPMSRSPEGVETEARRRC